MYVGCCGRMPNNALFLSLSAVFCITPVLKDVSIRIIWAKSVLFQNVTRAAV